MTIHTEEAIDKTIQLCAEKEPWQTIEFDADFLRECFEELKDLRRVNATFQSVIEQARYRMGSAYGKTHPFTMELRLANSLMETPK